MLFDALLNGDFIYLLLLCFFADIRTNCPGLPILSEDQKLSRNSPSCQRQIATAETTNERPEKLLRILNLSCKRWLLNGFPDHVSVSQTNRSLLVYISSSQVCSSNAAVLNPLQCFNSLIPYLMLGWHPNYKMISLLLYNCNFANVVNCNVNIWCAGYLICNSNGVTTHRLRTTALGTHD